MFMTILLTLAVLTGGFFAYRYLTLRHALRATRDELALIRRDLTQNWQRCLTTSTNCSPRSNRNARTTQHANVPFSGRSKL